MISVNDRFGEALLLMDEAKTAALEAVGHRMASHAKVYVPVDTGRLRDSLRYAVSGDVLTVGSAVDYAPYVEIGVSGRAGTHFLRNAAALHTAEYAGLISAVFSGKGGMKGGEEDGYLEGEA